jgi:sulfite exporter TauE/SafE
MLLGLVFGMGSCTIACLPYLGPVFIALGSGVRGSWRIILPFSLGRLSSYALLATMAGLSGQFIGDSLAGLKLRWPMGAAAIILGVVMLLRRSKRGTCTQCGRDDPLRPDMRTRSAETMMPGGLFLLGAAMALSPCAPLASVLFSATVCANGWHGLWLGLGFGLGAIVIPTIFYGIGFAWFGNRLSEQLGNSHRHIVRLSAALLILTGVGNLFA